MYSQKGSNQVGMRVPPSFRASRERSEVMRNGRNTHYVGFKRSQKDLSPSAVSANQSTGGSNSKAAQGFFEIDGKSNALNASLLRVNNQSNLNVSPQHSHLNTQVDSNQKKRSQSNGRTHYTTSNYENGFFKLLDSFKMSPQIPVARAAYFSNNTTSSNINNTNTNNNNNNNNNNGSRNSLRKNKNDSNSFVLNSSSQNVNAQLSRYLEDMNTDKTPLVVRTSQPESNSTVSQGAQQLAVDLQVQAPNVFAIGNSTTNVSVRGAVSSAHKQHAASTQQQQQQSGEDNVYHFTSSHHSSSGSSTNNNKQESYSESQHVSKRQQQQNCAPKHELLVVTQPATDSVAKIASTEERQNRIYALQNLMKESSRKENRPDEGNSSNIGTQNSAAVANSSFTSSTNNNSATNTTVQDAQQAGGNQYRRNKYNRFKSPLHPVRALQGGSVTQVLGQQPLVTQQQQQLQLDQQQQHQQHQIELLNSHEKEIALSTHNVNLPLNSTTQSQPQQSILESTQKHTAQQHIFASTSINFSADITRSLDEEEAVVEEMHYYFVDFQQKTKEWLKKVESGII